MLKKTIIEFGILIFCTILILHSVIKVLSPKAGNGIYDLKEFYELDRNSVDVLMLGSSLSFISLDPAVFYENSGIAGYSLGGALQPLNNTYFYLKEALKTQRPKLITLEIYCAIRDDELNNYYVLNNISAIRSPGNRLGAIVSSTTKDRWLSMFLGFPEYHDRYKELTNEDFQQYRGLKDFEYYLGHGTFYKTTECDRPIVDDEVEAISIPTKSEEYLLKIIELCDEYNIELLLFASPNAEYSDTMKGMYTYISSIAQDYEGVSFVDFNECYDTIGLDFQKDFADKIHLNHRGCPKFSEFFGNYLSESYHLEDHRGDGRYLRWEQAAEFNNASIQDVRITENNIRIESCLKNVREADSGEVVAYIWVTGEETDIVSDALIENDVPTEKGVYMISGGNTVWLDLTNSGYSFDFGKDVYTCKDDSMYKNSTQLFVVDEQLTMVVFDNYTMKLFDSCVINEDGWIVDRPVFVTWGWIF